MCGLFLVPNLALLSWQGSSRRFSRPLPAAGVGYLVGQSFIHIPSVYPYVYLYGMFQSKGRYTRCRVGQQVGLCLWRWFNSQIFFLCVPLIFFVCWRNSCSYNYENTYDDDGCVVWAIMKQVIYAHRVRLPLLPLLLCVLLCCRCCKNSGAAAFCYCSSSCTGWQYLVLVRTYYYASVLFFSIQTRYICVFPLLTPSRLLPLFTTSTVVTGMRVAKASVIPPGRSPPCIISSKQGERSSHVVRNSRNCMYVTVVSLGALVVLDKVCIFWQWWKGIFSHRGLPGVSVISKRVPTFCRCQN